MAFKITDETIALDVLRQVGHGNTFLSNIHTARNFKREIIQRDPSKGWVEATMSRAMVPEARKIAKRLLREHEVEQLDKSTVKEGYKIISDYEKLRVGKS